MPMFVCSECQAIDDTKAGGKFDLDSDEPFLCCECHTGHWHDNFAKVKATPRKIVENFVEHYQYAKDRDIVFNALREALCSYVGEGVEQNEIMEMDEYKLMDVYKRKCHWNRSEVKLHIVDLDKLQ